MDSLPPIIKPSFTLLDSDADRASQLVLAAYDLLAEAGLEGLTIRAVLARSGLARRAFYEQFSGKDDLVLAVFEQTLRAAAAHFRTLTQAIADPAQQVRTVVSSIVLGRIVLGENDEVVADDRLGAALSREHMRLAESRPAELQAALAPLLGLIAELIERGSASGRFLPCDAALVARLIYNTVSTTVHTELLTDEGAPPDPARRQQLADDIAGFCLRAIAAGSRSERL